MLTQTSYVTYVVDMECQCGSPGQTTNSKVDKLFSSGDDDKMCHSKWSSYLNKILEHITLSNLGVGYIVLILL